MSSDVCQLCLEALTPLAEQCAKAQETDSSLFLATRHFLKVRESYMSYWNWVAFSVFYHNAATPFLNSSAGRDALCSHVYAWASPKAEQQGTGHRRDCPERPC